MNGIGLPNATTAVPSAAGRSGREGSLPRQQGQQRAGGEREQQAEDQHRSPIGNHSDAAQRLEGRQEERRGRPPVRVVLPLIQGGVPVPEGPEARIERVRNLQQPAAPEPP